MMNLLSFTNARNRPLEGGGQLKPQKLPAVVLRP